MNQHRDVEEREKQLNKDFENVCDWFIDNKLSIHLGDDKTKFIFYSTMGQKGLSYIGPFLWKKLPRSIKKTPF